MFSIKVCGLLDSMIDAGTPPDLVLDLTKVDDGSDMINMITRSLGLPTVTSSHGDVSHLRGWHSLSPEQEKYLVQVRPSGMMMMMMIIMIRIITIMIMIIKIRIIMMMMMLSCNKSCLVRSDLPPTSSIT